MRRSPWSALALALVLLAPAAAAREADVRAELTLAGPLLVEGPTSARLGDATLDLLAGGAAVPELSWEAADGKRVVGRWRAVEGVPEDPSMRADAWNESVRLGPGRVMGLACGDECRVLAWGDVDLRPEGALSVRAEDLARLWCAQLCESGRNAASRSVPRGALAFDGEGVALGDVTLLVAGARLDTPGGSFETRRETQAAVGLPGARVHEYDASFLLLNLTGARLRLPTGGAWAASAAIAFEGGASGVGTGTVAYVGASREIEDEPFALDGAGTVGVLAMPGAAPVATVDGAASSIEVAGVRVQPTTLPAAPLAVVVLLLLLLAAAPFYSRIGPGDALAHPNRRRILEVLRDADGRSTAEMTRLTGMTRVVVEHHLRVLEDHGLVVSRRQGASRKHFLPERAPPPSEDDVQALLANPTRRRLVDALAQAQALTQREASQAAGISRRLAGYHLALLRDAGLVRMEEGRPARYVLERRAE